MPRLPLATAGLALGLTLAGTAAHAAAPKPPAKPNIIVFLADDCGYNEFSFNGSKLIKTPNIDAIAANGVKFTNGYVSGMVCSPSRAGLLTGRYQNRFGYEFNLPPVYTEDHGLPTSETLLPAVLKDGGYRTIALGKWHLGYAPKFNPVERGFTDYYGFLQGQRSYFPLEKPGKLNRMLRDREPVVPEKFDYLTDELGRAANEYITKHKDGPFFIYFAFNATHTPMQATEADIATVSKESPEQVKLRAMTLSLDRTIGSVVQHLKDQGLYDNTIIYFLPDNGGASGHDNAPLKGHKSETYEGGMRVPFAMQWPAVLPKGKVYDHPVISLDIFATSLAVAGIAKTPGKPLDGVNLIPYLTGENSGRPHPTLYWKNGPAWAVRDGDLKAVVGNPKVTATELYDLATDPGETRNLAAERPADVARLTKLHEEWKKDFPKCPWGHADDEESAAGSTEEKADKPAKKDKKKKK